VSDGGRGAFVVWQGRLSGAMAAMDVFALRVTTGKGVPHGGERRIRTGFGDVAELVATALPAGGVVVAWTEHGSPDDLVV